MVTKTLTITQEAYDMLKAAKKEDESFSEVIVRKFRPKLAEFIGTITEEEAEAMKDRIAAMRKTWKIF
jgi:predicted CopG family antitoxin